MSYTTDDLANVRSAIITFAEGNRRAEVSFGSSTSQRTIKFAQTSMTELRALEREIVAALDAQNRAAGDSSSRRFVRLSTGKGL